MEMPWPPAGWRHFTLHPDKGCIFNIEGERGPTWWTTQVTLVKDGSAVPTGVPGNYFIVDKANVKVQSLPFVAHFSSKLGDLSTVAFKVVGQQ